MPSHSLEATREGRGWVRSRGASAARGALAGFALLAALLVPSPAAQASARKATHAKSALAKTVAEVTSLLRGIPEEGATLGDPAATVTLQWFGDLECPSCKYFALETLPTLVKDFVRPGKIKIEFHSFQSATPEAAIFQEQQIAALAAGEQNKLWYYVDLFYHEFRLGVNTVTESYLHMLARQVPGLNVASWTSARSEPALAEQIASDAETGLDEGWDSTPDFTLTDGANLAPFRPVGNATSVFVKVIEERLAEHGVSA